MHAPDGARRTFGHANELAEGFDSGWHEHPTHRLLYSSQGALRLEVEAAQWLLPPRRGAWIAAETGHRVYSAGGASLRTVDFAPEGVAAPGPACCVFTVGALGREMILYAMRWGARREGEEEEMARPFFAALAALCRAWAKEAPALRLPTARSPALREAARRALARLDEALSLEETAARVGLSARTLTRRSHAELGMTWGQFINVARMIQAQESLTDPTRSVTEVAFEVGFESSAAFTRAFRRFTGQPPREWRQATLGEG